MMARKLRRDWQRKTAAMAIALCAACGGNAYAMPEGGNVTAGTASIAQSGSTMNINQTTDKAAIDWAGFNIAKGETVNFVQPDAASIALNRVISNTGTEIYGNLNANGQVFLINPNGVLFGAGSEVNVGGIVASTMDISNENFLKGNYTFAGDSTAAVRNAGDIKAEGGVVALLAHQVANEGSIVTTGGTTALAAGSDVHIDYEGDGKINLSVNGSAVNASALNSGSISANGGYVVMTARDASNVLNTVVNNSGVIEAKSLKNVNGTILLDGGDQGVVQVGGSIDASGDAAGQTGGNIKAIGAVTNVLSTASLKATGDQAGGLIETSGDVLNVDSNASIDASSANGTAGEWLLDPLKVVIDTDEHIAGLNVTAETLQEAATGDTSDNTYKQIDGGTGNASASEYDKYNKTSYVSAKQITGMLDKGTAVTITALDNNKVASIVVDAEITKEAGADTSFTLNAQRDITINKNITSTAGKLNVNLHSDTDGDQVGAVTINANIATNGGSFTSGSGAKDIEYNANGTIKSSTPDYTVGSVGTYFGSNASSVTTGGGDINLYGDVAIGTGKQLTLDATGADKTGSVTITGNVDSGNAYKVVYFGKTDGMTWEDAKKAAQGTTDGGSAEKDTYLATVTTALENSVINSLNAGQSAELFVGGKFVVTKDSRTAYWVTGPEGAANGGKGTAFYEVTRGDRGDIKVQVLNNLYAKWQTGEPNNMNDKSYENNRQPYVAVGYGANANWDDVHNGGGLKGYVQETNLADSGLAVKANNVTIGGNVGSSKALSSLDIAAAGAVKTGTLNADKTVKYAGSIHVDDSVTISSTEARAASADIGGKITAAGGAVNIYTKGDITTNGIDAKAKIALSSNGGSYDGSKNIREKSGTGTITLNDKIVTASTDKDAVVIDTKGRFVNQTKNAGSDTTAAITTGAGGNWKVYSATPHDDVFGSNLNSGAKAVWVSTSNGSEEGYKTSQYKSDTLETTAGRYIFAYTPQAAVKATDGTKTYGESAEKVVYAHGNGYGSDYNKATYTKDGVDYAVEDFSGYNAFVQDTVQDVFDVHTLGNAKKSPAVSEGFAAAARRDGGDYDEDKDNTPDHKDKYIIGLNMGSANGVNLSNKSYKLVKENGVLTINPITVTIGVHASQEYGSSTVTSTFDSDAAAKSISDVVVKTNGDSLDGSSVKYDPLKNSNYNTNKGIRTTADADEYAYTDGDQAVTAVITDKNGNADTVDYKIIASGNITVTPKAITLDTVRKVTYGQDYTGIGTDGSYTTDVDHKATDSNNFRTGAGYENNKLVNEDSAITSVTNQANQDYLTNRGNRNTADYKDGGYVATKGSNAEPAITSIKVVDKDGIDRSKNYVVADGSTSTILVEKAALKVKTHKDITYGQTGVDAYTTAGAENTGISGLVNGDEKKQYELVVTSESPEYKASVDKGANRTTADVNTYKTTGKTFTLTSGTEDLTKNYKIQSTGDIKVDTAAIHITLKGTNGGNITDSGSYAAGLTNGDTVSKAPAASYGYTDGAFTAAIGNTPIAATGTGTVVGNYKFTYDGVMDYTPVVPVTPEPAPTPAPVPTLTPTSTPTVTNDNVSVDRPKLDYVGTSNLDGTGAYDVAGGSRGVPGVDRVAGLTDAQLPFFKVADKKVYSYGAYNVSETPEAVKLEASGKRIPEPEPKSNQYRALDKDIALTDGEGRFTLS